MNKLPWNESRFCLGVYIGITSIHAVLLKKIKNERHVIKDFNEQYITKLKSDSDNKIVEQALNQLLDYFSRELESDYIDIQISLADTLVNSAVFDLDQVPKNQAMKDDLIAMRFKKECHIDTQKSLISSQLYKTNDHHVLYAIASPRSLIDSIEQCLSVKQLHAVYIDKAIHYVFNYYYQQLDSESAMLYSSGDYWTLVIWDNQKNAVYFRSKPVDTKSLKDTRAHDVLRLLQTYKQSHSQKINMLYLVNSTAEGNELDEVIRNNGEFNTKSLCYKPGKKESLAILDDPALYAAIKR